MSMDWTRRGYYVQTWHDTGAMGWTPLYGQVIASGPRTFTVEWESGLRSRMRRDAPRCQPARDAADAAAAMASARAVRP